MNGPYLLLRCMKDSLSTIGNTFLCQVIERVGDGMDTNIWESMNLGSGECPDRVEKFCYLGDLPSRGGGANSASVA